MLCKWRVKNADAFPKIRMRLGHEGVNFDTPSFFFAINRASRWHFSCKPPQQTFRVYVFRY